MNTTQKARLDKLITHLQTVEATSPKTFNLRHWGHGNLGLLDETWPEEIAAGKPLTCGAAACVIGHAAVLFPEAFKMSVGGKEAAEFCGGRPEEWRNIIYPYGYDGNDVEFTAGAGHFGEVKLSAVLDRLRKLRTENAGQNHEKETTTETN